MSKRRRADVHEPPPDIPLGVEGYWDGAFFDRPFSPSVLDHFDLCADCTGCSAWEQNCFNHR